jgi:hypothetical protein
VGKGYLIYKVTLALFWLTIIVIDLTRNSLTTSTFSDALKYLIFYTRYFRGLFLLTA